MFPHSLIGHGVSVRHLWQGRQGEPLSGRKASREAGFKSCAVRAAVCASACSGFGECEPRSQLTIIAHGPISRRAKEEAMPGGPLNTVSLPSCTTTGQTVSCRHLPCEVRWFARRAGLPWGTLANLYILLPPAARSCMQAHAFICTMCALGLTLPPSKATLPEEMGCREGEHRQLLAVCDLAMRLPGSRT